MSSEFENKLKEILSIKNCLFSRCVTRINIENANEVRIETKKFDYRFYCNSKRLTIRNKINFRGIRYHFSEWNIFINDLCSPIPSKRFLPREKLASFGLNRDFFILHIIPFLRRMFVAINDREKTQEDDLKKGINLISLDNWPLPSEIKSSNWYKKLLQDYTEYYQSGSKSDIADRHYQEQARLHGLKFVIK